MQEIQIQIQIPAQLPEVDLRAMPTCFMLGGSATSARALQVSLRVLLDEVEEEEALEGEVEEGALPPISSSCKVPDGGVRFTVHKMT